MLSVRKTISLGIVVLVMAWCLVSTIAVGTENKPEMTISGFPQDMALQRFVGNAWAIYLDGPVDKDAAQRLEQFLESNKVPALSWVILNSNGGNLFAGMALGDVIRKNGLRTDVGKRKAGATRTFEYDPGDCHSACTLAYLGGRFRYLSKGAHFGVHRFAFSTPQKDESGLAQVASASIVAYLRSMDVDTDFFKLSTIAGPNEIYEPPLAELKKLNVVTYSFEKPKWTVESNNGVIYLKGERQSEYGVNKIILYCDSPKKIILYIVFDPQGRNDEVMQFSAHSLIVNGRHQKISPTFKAIKNGWFNSMYVLDARQLAEIKGATTLGVIVRPTYEAPIFLGFDSMPFNEGKAKFEGVTRSCSY